MTERDLPPAQPPRRVLIIEDYEDTALLLTALMKNEGYDVRMELAGNSGLNAAQEFLPEIILCDIGLPDIDGYTIARRLREQPAFREVLMVAVTAYAQDSDRLLAKDAGFDHHLAKPVNFRHLLGILRAGSRDCVA